MRMDVNDYCHLLDPALEVAIEAGRKILGIYESGFSVSAKGDETPVTDADIAAHNTIHQGLKRLTPEIPVLSEESVNIPFNIRKSWGTYWLVDPLDGTVEFIKRTGEFTVNIALIVNGIAIIGIIYAPVLGTYYFACHGHGAYKRAHTSQPKRITARKVATNQKIVIACGRARCSSAFQTLLQQLPDYEIITLGSALKSCLVAEGKADLYARLGPTSEWDTAAAQCIVEEAGGHLTGLDLTPLKYNQKENLLNPHFLVFGDPTQDWTSFLIE